jgi:hypothetical protein
LIEPRIYRAAFLPAVLAVVLCMFSLESRPRPLPQGLAADVLFDGRAAATSAREIVAAAPDRRAGRPGDRATASAVRSAFRDRGFAVTVRRFEHSGKKLVNVVGKRAGRSRREVVVVAARDAAGIPDAGGSAAGTAALLELARVFEGRPSDKTLVLASIDGTTLGEIGTKKLGEDLGEPGLVDGILVVSGLANPVKDRPVIVSWSNGPDAVGIGLERTVAASLRLEINGGAASGPSSLGQFARLAFPVGIGSQGVLLERGYDAVRISGDGELLGSATTPPERIDPDRLGALGRATLRTVTALDQGSRPEHGPRTYLTPVSQVMPGWVLAVLAASLILPALVASIDAFARARRRREHVAPWMLWIAAGAVPFLLGFGVAELLALTGATPDPPPAPVSPDLYPLDSAAAVSLGVVAVVIALAWIGLRWLAIRADGALRDARDHGAAVAVALTLSVTTALVLLANPFFALLLVPGLHLWILATLTDPPPPARARLVMLLLGLVPPALLAVYELIALELNPISGAWYLFLLVTGGQVGLAAVVLGSVLAALFGSVAAILRAGDPDQVEPGGPSVRGPAGYAGPGSLGGTGSALKR